MTSTMRISLRSNSAGQQLSARSASPRCTARTARRTVVVAARLDSSRRDALAAVLGGSAGLLLASPAVAAGPLPEVPEPTLRKVIEPTVKAVVPEPLAAKVPEVTTAQPESSLPSVEAPVLQAPSGVVPTIEIPSVSLPAVDSVELPKAAPLSKDQMMIGGGAAAVVAIAGLAAAANGSGSSEDIGSGASPKAASRSPVNKNELAAAEEELSLRLAALEALKAELNPLSERVAQASAAKGSTYAAQVSAVQQLIDTQASAQEAAAAEAEARASYAEIEAMGGMQRLFAKMTKGKSLVELKTKLAEAEANALDKQALATAACAADRRAWIANWRANAEIIAAKALQEAKMTEIGILAAVVQEAQERVAALSPKPTPPPAAPKVAPAPIAELSAEDRVADRQAWIAAWRATTQSLPAVATAAPAAVAVAAATMKTLVPENLPAGASYDSPMEDRLADRKSWISAWQSTQPSTGGMSYNASVEDRLADRQSWIAAWKANQPADGKSYSASVEDRLADRQSWIAAWKATAKAGVKEPVLA